MDEDDTATRRVRLLQDNLVCNILDTIRSSIDIFLVSQETRKADAMHFSHRRVVEYVVGATRRQWNGCGGIKVQKAERLSLSLLFWEALRAAARPALSRPPRRQGLYIRSTLASSYEASYVIKYTGFSQPLSAKQVALGLRKIRELSWWLFNIMDLFIRAKRQRGERMVHRHGWLETQRQLKHRSDTQCGSQAACRVCFAPSVLHTGLSRSRFPYSDHALPFEMPQPNGRTNRDRETHYFDDGKTVSSWEGSGCVSYDHSHFLFGPAQPSPRPQVIGSGHRSHHQFVSGP